MIDTMAVVWKREGWVKVIRFSTIYNSHGQKSPLGQAQNTDVICRLSLISIPFESLGSIVHEADGTRLTTVWSQFKINRPV